VADFLSPLFGGKIPLNRGLLADREGGLNLSAGLDVNGQFFRFIHQRQMPGRVAKLAIKKLQIDFRAYYCSYKIKSRNLFAGRTQRSYPLYRHIYLLSFKVPEATFSLFQDSIRSHP